MFTVLAVVVVSLQSTVAVRLAPFGWRPDWVLVCVVFYALHAGQAEAALAGCILGALAGVMSLERFGLLALCYGLTALGVGAIRELVFTRHPLTHMSATLAAAALVQMMWLVYRLAVGLPAGAVGPMLGSSVHTALWAVPFHAVLLKAPRLLGIRHARTA